MKLTKLTVKNFASFKDEAVLPIATDVTVICGRNNAGKSSLMSALLAATSERTNGTDWSYGRLGESWRIAVEFDAPSSKTLINAPVEVRAAAFIREVNRLAFEVSRDPGVWDIRVDVNADLGGDKGAPSPIGDVIVHQAHVREWMDRIFVMRAERSVHSPDQNASGHTRLEPDCRNVLQMLNSLSGTRPIVFRRIGEHAARLLPGVESILAPIQAGSANLSGEAVETAFPNVKFGWNDVAAGTRHLMAMLIMLEATPEDSLLLMEEPESFLHPEVTVQLFELCEEIARAQGKQIVMTTHSPLLMELAGADRLSVVVRDPATGASSIERMDPKTAMAFERRGLMKSYMLTPLEPGTIPSLLIIVEGIDDVVVWDAIIDKTGLRADGVRVTDAGEEGGEGAAERLALYMRHLSDSGMGSAPFLLFVDSDGNADEKASRYREAGLREDDFAFTTGHSIESYLFDAPAIARVLGLEMQEVTLAMEGAWPHSKSGLKDLIHKLKSGTTVDSKLKSCLAAELSIDSELASFALSLKGRIRRRES